MTNIYWPVFKNLERGVSELTFAIHVDDTQLDVYSSRITDLILRAAAEIESLAKELYAQNGGTKTGQIKYDDDAIKHLKNLWALDKKVVVISSPNCFQTQRVLTPLVKNVTRTGSAKQTYSWNNAYQNLKHDRGNSIAFGSVRFLFDIMAALFVLNVYFRDETIELGKDSSGTTFEPGVGSELFSVQFASRHSYDGKGQYKKPDDFDESIYFMDWTEDSAKPYLESVANMEQHRVQLILQNPKIQEYCSQNDVTNYEGNLAWDVLGKDEYVALIQQTMRAVPIKIDQLLYHALLNKKQH